MAFQGHVVKAPAKKQGVVVIQEWWGLVPHVKDVVQRFAQQAGYTAAAPDLYEGKTTLDAAEAQHLAQGLDWPKAAKAIGETVQMLREQEGCTKVGVVGFCMGGALSVIAATQPGVDAWVSFYGFPPKGAAPLEKITAPGLVFFGEREEYFSVPDAKEFAKKQGKTEVLVYPNAGHAFFNDARPEAYQKEAANDAWRRTLAHFGKHLRG